MIGWIKPVLEIKCYYEQSFGPGDGMILTGLTLNEFKRLNETYMLMFSYPDVFSNVTTMSFLYSIDSERALLANPIAGNTAINLSVGDPDSTILELTASSDDDPFG